MGKRGPLPQTDRISYIRNRGGMVQESKPTSKAPRPPIGMPLDERRWWKLIVAKMAPNFLAEIDQTALADFCKCLVRLKEAELEVNKGFFHKNQNGIVKSPAIAIANYYRTAVQLWAREFGMTPNSRARIPEKAKTATQPDGFEDLLS